MKSVLIHKTSSIITSMKTGAWAMTGQLRYYESTLDLEQQHLLSADAGIAVEEAATNTGWDCSFYGQGVFNEFIFNKVSTWSHEPCCSL